MMAFPDKVLLDVGENLRLRDLKFLKFLWQDVKPSCRLERCDAIELIEEISNFSPDHNFLPKFLKKIGRVDLLKKLNSDSGEIEDFQPTELSSFRSLLFDLALDLKASNVKDLKFIYRQHSKCKEAVDGFDLMTIFIELDIINRNSLQCLINKLNFIKRNDLAIKLENYCPQPMENETPPTQNSIKQQDKVKMKEYYKMDAKPRGFCVIINIIEFKTNQRRESAVNDNKKLMELFQYLEFEVYLFLNLSGNEIKDNLKDFSGRDHSGYDCFVCFIMSHGIKGMVFGSNDEPVEIDTLIELFNSDICPSLENKPKLFFIQACQMHPPKEEICETDDDKSSISSKSPLKKANICKVISTISGHVSFRHDDGARFIKHLHEVFFKHAKEWDFEDMLKYIMKEVSNDGHESQKQLPVYKSTLFKSIRFL